MSTHTATASPARIPLPTAIGESNSCYAIEAPCAPFTSDCRRCLTPRHLNSNGLTHQSMPLTPGANTSAPVITASPQRRSRHTTCRRAAQQQLLLRRRGIQHR
jgi:hypothetical protein